MLKIIVLFAVVFTTAYSSKIDQKLMVRVNKGDKVNVLIFFVDGVKSPIERTNMVRSGDDRSSFVKALKENADSSQSTVVQSLSARSGQGGFEYYKTFWSSNKMFIKKADPKTIKMIAEDAQVAKIIEEPTMRIPKAQRQLYFDEMPFGSTPGITTKGGQINHTTNGSCTHDGSCCIGSWHIERIKRDESWVELGGNRGEGVIVATIDTGVRHTHEALRANFRGEYGWFDGVNGTLEPLDEFGHGTSVTTVLAGFEKLGIAPGATWMSCRGCDGEIEGDECKIEHVLNCIQFMLCPTLADGSNPDCTKAPHVLSLSLGGERDTAPLEDDLLTLKTAGIISVAAVGNEGRKDSCGSSESPANAKWVIGVGASTWCDQVISYSAIGPAPDGTIKPDLIAPGVFILSADSQTDTSYTVVGGTSNATPQVAGTVALLHVRNPNITFEEAYQFITQSTFREIKPYGLPYLCNESFTEIPNNYFGHGRLDMLAALQAQTVALQEDSAEGYFFISSKKGKR